MLLRNLADVKVEVLSGEVFQTPWVHDRGFIRLENPLNQILEALLQGDGRLHIYRGYMCDGASGPTFDDATNRIPAVVHDVAYQLLRSGLAPPSLTRKSADQLFRKMLLEHGMPKWRASYYYWALRIGGASAAKPRKTEKKYTYLEA